MISEEIQKIKSGKRDLRQFGLTMGAVLGVLGILFLWRGKWWYPHCMVASALFFAFGFFLPRWLKPLHRIWMTFALLMGWIMTRVVLIVLFYLVVTPIGLVMRWSGKDPLNRGFDRSRDSYWIPRAVVPATREDYEKQF